MVAKIKETVQKARNTKSTRIWFMVLLLVILWILYFTSAKMKGLIIALILIVLTAIGVQVFDYDLDLATLIDTRGDVAASRVEYKDGIKILGEACAGDNLNCSDFATQQEAQAKYESCATAIASYNDGQSADSIKNLDVYWLDGNNNGIVCEALPAWA